MKRLPFHPLREVGVVGVEVRGKPETGRVAFVSVASTAELLLLLLVRVALCTDS